LQLRAILDAGFRLARPRAMLEQILAAIEGGETTRDVRNARAALAGLVQMGNDLDQRFIDRPQFALQKATSACKMTEPIDGRIDASRRIKGDQYQTTAFISSLRHEFPSFAEKNPCCFIHSTTAAVGNEFGAGHDFAGHDLADRDFADHHLGNAPASRRRRKAFIAYWTEILSIACITARATPRDNFTGETNVAKCRWKQTD
jgi:hypothetical protein